MLGLSVMKIVFISNQMSCGGESALNSIIDHARLNNDEVYVLSNGFIKNFFNLFRIQSIKPNTIHVHGWNVAFSMFFLRFFLSRDTSLLLTIDTPPFSTYQRIASIITNIFDHVFVSSRTVQYQLLSIYNIKSFYIPNGYTKPYLEDIKPRVFGLRENQYGVILSQSLDTITRIAKAYASAKSKKKLVIFAQNPSKDLQRIIKIYPFITPFSLPLTSRGAQSITRASSFVILEDETYSPLLLQAMDTDRIILSSTNSYLEEILGTTGFYYSPTDTDHLIFLLKQASKTLLKPKYASSTRAQRHFTWEKIGQEYDHFYSRKTIKTVPFDSLVPKSYFQNSL
jgi:glycosyltransferase involved in cell wall biosynthesis